MTTPENMKLVAEDQRNFTAFVESVMPLYQQFARKHDPAGAAVGNYYGPGGVLSYPLARPQTYSAMVQPRSFLDALPIRPSRIINEVTTILTGQTDATGTNPTDICGTPPTPGNLKFCRTNNPYGQFFVGSKVVNVPSLGLYDTHGVEPITIQNFATSDSPLIPDPLRAAGVNFGSETALRLYEVATMIRRIMARIEVDGDPTLAPAAAERGWIREFGGLSRQIVNNTTDISGVACPAADSLVEVWNAATGATVNGRTLPQLIHDMYYARQQLADDVDMMGTEFVWVMDKRLFRAIAFIFACTYAYARCGDASSALPIQREAAELERRFNEMMNGQFLLIGGVPVPVLFTSGAEVTDSTSPITNGRIFLVPMRWQGNNLTYLHFAPQTQDQEAWNALGNSTGRFISNNGLYHMATRSNGFCDQLLATGRVRLHVDARFLGARVDGISFDSYVGYRSFDPNSSSFYDGGITQYTNYVG